MMGNPGRGFVPQLADPEGAGTMMPADAPAEPHAADAASPGASLHGHASGASEGITVRGYRDVVGGALLMAGAAAFGLMALGYKIGTPARMGPGFFPLILSALLFTLGLIIAAKALRQGAAPLPALNWRGLAWIVLPCAAFGATVDTFGLVPVLFLTVLGSTFASRRMHLGLAIVVSLAIVAFCYVVFLWGLGLPLPAFRFPSA